MFTWVPIYREIAEKLIEYEKKQHELLEILQELKSSGVKVIKLEEENDGEIVPLKEIDPFTFMGVFNRFIRDKERRNIISFLKDKWSLEKDIPTDFSGIPIVNNMSSWFFGSIENRKKSDIPNLWKLFKEGIEGEITEESYNNALEIYKVNRNITMGLFWVNPEIFLSMDKKNQEYLKSKNIATDFSNYQSYMKTLEDVNSSVDEDFLVISQDAWLSSQSVDEENTDESIVERENKDIRFWIYAPGRGAKYWNECVQNSYMLFGADELDNLFSYSSRDEIVSELQRINNDDKSHKNDSLACWQFSREIKIGDIIIAKKGIDSYLGYGVVDGEYSYDEKRSTYRNIIPVKWEKTKPVKEPQGPIVQKTLTDVTRYTDYVKRLIELLEIDFNIDKAIDSEIEELPQNMIIYGPPGTGKTYSLTEEYMPRYFITKHKNQNREEYLIEIVQKLNWFQVIALAMLNYDATTVPILLQDEAIQTKASLSNNNNLNATLWSWLQMHTLPECERVNYKRRYEPAVFWKNEESQWEIKRDVALEMIPEIIEIHEKLKNYQSEETVEKRYEFVTFHQSFSYEDFVEGIKPDIADEGSSGDIIYRIEDGIFKQMAQKARLNREKKYCLFIDEINRGNVAGIFGELITLIEKDKRDDGNGNGLEITLPYSKKKFSVPNNLYLIGTMNTADRSIESLDSALRRRFSFKPCLPNPSLLNQDDFPTVGVDLEKTLIAINKRIEALLDKDHAIGHSYFLAIDDKTNPLEELQSIFENKIIPLLEEYFYNDRSKLKMILGGAFVKETVVDEDLFCPLENESTDVYSHSTTIYTIQIPATLEGFRSIYE